MKPFMEGEGLGPLSGNYEKFPAGTMFVHTHERLKVGRNMMFAHRDFLNAPKQLSKREDQESLIISVEIKGTATHVTVDELTWDMKAVPAISDLCLFQATRASDEMKGVLQHLRDSKGYQNGVYKLGGGCPVAFAPSRRWIWQWKGNPSDRLRKVVEGVAAQRQCSL